MRTYRAKSGKILERRQNMDKKERLLNAFNNKSVDHVPSGFFYHFPEKAVSNEEVAQAEIGYYQSIDADFIKIMSDGYFNYPNPQIREFTSAADWKKLKPLGKDSEFVAGQIKRCGMISERLNGACCTFYNVFNPMSYLRFEIGDERLMHDVREDEDAVKMALDTIAEDVIAIGEGAIKEGGCEGVYYCLQNAEINRFTEEEYKRIVAPSERRALNRINRAGENNILHLCGYAGIPNHLEVWKDYESKVVNWAVFVEKMDLVRGKEYFGGRCVLGGFDNTASGVLQKGTKKEIQEYTHDLLEKAGTTGIVLGGDCTFPRGFDVQRFRWVMDEAASFHAK
jgi:uroporphyrinogen-III decarboxylase